MTYHRLWVGALILNSSTNALMGSAGIDTDAYPEPANAAEVKLLGKAITDREHRDGTLPPGQYYVIVSWQRYREDAR